MGGWEGLAAAAATAGVLAPGTASNDASDCIERPGTANGKGLPALQQAPEATEIRHHDCRGLVCLPMLLLLLLL